MSDSLEQPAKRWEVVALKDALGEQKKLQDEFNARVEKKLDQILQNQITTQQVEQRLATFRREMELTYSPTTKEVRRIYVALTGFFLLQVGVVALNKWG